MYVMNNFQEGQKYDIQLEVAKFFVQRFTLKDHALIREEKILNANGAMYPLSPLTTVSFVAEQGSLSINKALSFSQKLPKYVYVFQISRDKENSIHRDPYYFQSFDVSDVALQLDEQKFPEGIGYSVNFNSNTWGVNSGEWAIGYRQFQRELNFQNPNSTITPYAWSGSGGYTIFVFSLQRDKAALGCGYLSPRSDLGQLNLLIKWRTPLPEAVKIFCIMEYSRVLHISKEKIPKWIE